MKLLPCPFCGKAEDKPVVQDRPMGIYVDIYQVRCEFCGAKGPEGSTKEEAIYQWEIRD